MPSTLPPGTSSTNLPADRLHGVDPRPGPVDPSRRTPPCLELARWTRYLASPGPEPRASAHLAHLGALAAWTALLAYLTWRVTSTLPASGGDRVAAWVLLGFEALPLGPLLIRTVTLWNIDSRAPRAVMTAEPGLAAVVMIPTYDEPAEVIAPTIAAACALEPAHATWVLDDGNRPWVAELCAAYGARHVTREVHDHAKAGNMNHAFALLDAETAAGGPAYNVVAVLDCDHVPLPHFLTATLGWFDDPELALVQAPQTYYNSGAFDDDGITGEQGMFFHVLLPGRNHDGAGPFWCGSTSLLRIEALRQVGWISTETIVEDMHTTLGLIRAGWKTVYHHQVVALGLAPATAEQYLLQRRRWAMGSMQVLTHERLWGAKRWLSWRNYYEYLTGTVWWLEGVATLAAFMVPIVLLLSGAQTSTAAPGVFALMLASTFFVRLWGVTQLFRGHLHLPTSYALRIFRIPVGLACLWWLMTRRELGFQVTPKGGAQSRVRGQVPLLIRFLVVLTLALLLYAAAGVLGIVPWRATPAATLASAVWLVVGLAALILGVARIAQQRFASSRRNAYRLHLEVPVMVHGHDGHLLDVSLGGAAVVVDAAAPQPGQPVVLVLPQAEPITLEMVRCSQRPVGDVWSLRVRPGDWAAQRVLGLWMFHTPDHAAPGLPAGVPAVGVRG